jgi:hypothetical protein
MPTPKSPPIPKTEHYSLQTRFGGNKATKGADSGNQPAMLGGDGSVTIYG